ncbi:hypothetical protein [Marinicauda sp. Alg238-R41]|uniref:hypothetical protein n=1 Tax=Marinicauda sp. Alg238-R41 TaxID=2993447 RepID=UPI0022DFDD6B|nr:hypothetical protein [Marinicauda sp. Alg238-R41]
MGAAVQGPAGCTCDVPESRVETPTRRLAEAHAYIIRLEEKSQARLEHQRCAWRTIQRLRTRVSELERALAAREDLPS